MKPFLTALALSVTFACAVFADTNANQTSDIDPADVVDAPDDAAPTNIPEASEPDNKAIEKGDASSEPEDETAEELLEQQSAQALSNTSSNPSFQDYTSGSASRGAEIAVPHGIGHTGAFTYSIPIDIPSYRGLVPNLALRYSSADRTNRSVDTIMGPGWSVSGLSRIERVSIGGGTPYFDDKEDVFRLDGMDLMACNDAEATNKWTGVYPNKFKTSEKSASCLAGGNFAPLVENFQKIEFSGHAGRASYFIMTRSDGTRFTYRTLDWATNLNLPAGHAAYKAANDRVWLLTQIANQQENVSDITIKYRALDASHGFAWRPTELHYGDYRILLRYSTQDKPLATFAVGALGHMGIQNKRLESIAVYDKFSRIRAYQLNYQTSPLTQTDVLASVQQYGNDFAIENSVVTGGSTLPAIELGYTQEEFRHETTDAGGNMRADVHVWDFDGDNRQDLFEAKSTIPEEEIDDGQDIPEIRRPSRHIGFDENRRLIQKLKNFAVADPYADWEILDVAADAFRSDSRYFLETFSRQIGDRAPHTQVIRRRVAINPDGTRIEQDLPSAAPGAPSRIGGEGPYSFLSIGRSPTIVLRNDRSYQVLGRNASLSQGCVFPPFGTTGSRWAADPKGNGETVLFTQRTIYSNTVESRFCRALERPDHGNGWDQTHSFVTQLFSVSAIGDVNGDGRDDIVGVGNSGTPKRRVYVSLSNGVSYEPAKIWAQIPLLDKQSIRLADLNGDGLSDFIIYGLPSQYINVPETRRLHNGVATVKLSNGQAFVAPPSVSSVEFSKFAAAADLDGDGISDIAGEQVHFADFKPPHLLTSIKNVEGGRTAIRYLPSTHPAVNSDDKIPGVRQLVYTISQSNGRGGDVRETKYRYSGGRFEWDFRRSLGFKTVKAYLPKLPDEATRPYILSNYTNSNLARAGWWTRRTFSDGQSNQQIISRTGSFRISGTGPFRALLRSTKAQSKDENRWITKRTILTIGDFGEVTLRRHLGATNDQGNVNLDPSDDLTTAYSYSRDRARFIMDRPSTVTRYAAENVVTDPAKLLARYKFYYDGNSHGVMDGPGNLTRVKPLLRNASGDREVNIARYSYDTYGNLVSHTDARGHRTTYTYETDKNLFRVSAENALGHRTATRWDKRCQAPNRETDVNGLETNITFDAYCREFDRILPTGNVIRSRIYGLGNPNGQHRFTKSNSASEGTNQQVQVVREFFDGFGEVYRTTIPGHFSTETGEDDGISILSGYDRRGNLSWQTIPIPGADRNAYPDGPPDSITQRFTYDARDRLRRTTLPDGAFSTTEYQTRDVESSNGTIIPHRASRNRSPDCHDFNSQTLCGEVVIVEDTNGRPVQNILFDRQGTDEGATGIERVTRYSYDPLDRLIQVTDPQGSTWRYHYDSFGNRILSDDPDLGLWTMEYDDASNLIRQRDAKLQDITFDYDALNRVTTKSVYPGTGPVQTTHYTYDKEVYRWGGLTKYRNTGQPTSIRTGNYEVRYDYHETGGIERERHKVDGRWYYISRKFAETGDLLNEYLPNTPGSTARAWTGEYRYDASNRVIGFGTHITGVDYDLRGNPTQVWFGNGVEERRDYSQARGFLDRIRLYEGGGRHVGNTRYTRSASGRIMTQYTAWRVARYAFTYDYAGRLLNADNTELTQHAESYRYNAAGSLTYKSNIGTYRYNAPSGAHPHAPRRVGSTDLTYDANGNMLRGYDGKVMTYDGENRPLSVTHAGQTTSYVYGPDGSRLKRIEGGNTVVTFANVEIRNFGSPAETVLSYPHPSVRLENGVASYLHRDHLSSIRFITDAAGSTTARYHYRPFGNQTASTDPAMVPETKGWIGERFDAGAGLMYLNARYYDPELALFLQPDWFEVTEPGVGTNRYAYSANDPVNLMDPGGNQTYDNGPPDDGLRDEDQIDEYNSLEQRVARAGMHPRDAELPEDLGLFGDLTGINGAIDTVEAVRDGDLVGVATGVGEAALGKVKVAARAGQAAIEVGGDAINYLYRGVRKGHPRHADALEGRVVPGNVDGQVTPREHNLGGVSAESPYTSWTRDPGVARRRAGEGGVVLRTPTGKPGPNDQWSWEYSDDVFGEQEVLLRGPRDGLEVLQDGR